MDAGCSGGKRVCHASSAATQHADGSVDFEARREGSLVSIEIGMDETPLKRRRRSAGRMDCMQAGGSGGAGSAAAQANGVPPLPPPPVSVASYKWISNVFHAMNEGRTPAEKIFDRQHWFALLDHAPVTHGHALLIAKHPVATLLEPCIPQEAAASCFTELQARARAACGAGN